MNGELVNNEAMGFNKEGGKNFSDFISTISGENMILKPCKVNVRSNLSIRQMKLT